MRYIIYVYLYYLAAMKSFTHYASKGFEKEILFANEREFIAGMNRIAVCIALCIAAGRSVNIIAFCLMDNHFHFILYGEREDCDMFVRNYAKLTAMWVAQHREHPLMEKIETGYWFISPDKLGQKIVYLYRNPVVAGLRVMPQGYRWSSAFLVFSDNDWMTSSAKRFADISIREQHRITSSHTDLPKDWLVLQNGMIWPGCYTATSYAEKQFPTIQAFLFELNNRKNDQETEEEMARESFSLPDSDVKFRATQLSMEYFRKTSIMQCSATERLSLARLLRQELKCNSKQLARVLHLQREELSRLV